MAAVHAVVNRDGLSALNAAGLLPESISSKIGTPLNNTHTASRRGDTAIIPIQGILTPRASMFSDVSGLTSSETILQDFTAAMEDNSIKNILLQVDSGGGAVTGISDVADAIFAARGSKPIFTHIVGEMASAALWIGTSADKVFASKTALVGSIGTVATIDTTVEEGSIEIVSTLSPNKRQDPTSKEGRNAILAILDNISTIFIDTVARNRGTTAQNVQENFGQGGMFIAAEALDLGLIDGIASFDEVLNMIQTGTNLDQKTTKPNKRMNAMSITKEQIAAEHAPIAEAFKAEGKAEAMAASAENLTAAIAADRVRVASILASSPAGMEAEAHAAIAAGLSAGEFALKVLEAQKTRLAAVDQANVVDAQALGNIGASTGETVIDAEKAEEKALFNVMTKQMNK